MALYEVMSKARAKKASENAVEPLKPKKKPEKEKVNAVPQASPEVKPKGLPPRIEDKTSSTRAVEVPEPQVSTAWRKKPRIVQYNLGRIEFSIPYQLAITAGLAILLLFLLAFRFGQYSGRSSSTPAVARPSGNSGTGGGRAGLPGLSTSGTVRTSEEGSRPPASRVTAPPAAASTGDNVIVLAEFKAAMQLVPVKDYFGKKGIPTEIVSVGNTYMLVTVERFDYNPSNPGTKGNELIQKIVEIGKGYQAPPNYEPFTPNLFKDAYGKKLVN